MSTANTSTILGTVVSLSKFLVGAFALWILSGAIMWTVVRPWYLANNPDAYMTILAAWTVMTCAGTWALGQRY